MWGPSIVGFGSYRYSYDSGREGDMPLIAFSPRKAAIVLYGASGSATLVDIDETVLKKIVAKSVAAARAR
ncbi:MAG TPA: hypothetical protein VII69_02100 [Candidatus Eremiobacteraceae bacterium]